MIKKDSELTLLTHIQTQTHCSYTIISHNLVVALYSLSSTKIIAYTIFNAQIVTTFSVF